MRKRNQIILDALLVRTKPTGVGRSILELVKALAQIDHEYDFKVLATAPQMFDFLAGNQNWEVIECPEANGGTLKKAIYTQTKLPGLVKKLGGSLLHSLQYIAPLQLSVPNVVTVHDLTYLRYPETVEQPRRGYYNLLVAPTLKKAAAIVTNSQATADEVISYFPKTVSRVSVTPFGTPSWIWEPGNNVAATQTGDLQSPYFLFVGTLEPRKNLEGLLLAYNAFLESERKSGHSEDSIPNLVFVGGKGWRDSSLREKMDQQQQAGRLLVVDYCTTNDLRNFYRNARALLFPSLHEGFGFPILEAMASGLPVLTSNRGAMAEVGGSAALLVDPSDIAAMVAEITSLHHNPELRNILSERGFERAKMWSWEKTATATLATYGRVLA